MPVTHINPEAMFKSPAFSQAVAIERPAKLIVVGGQNGIDAAGNLAGPDLASQTRQALLNVLTALEAAGATPQDVLKLTIYLVQGQSPEAGYAAAQEVWRQPTAVSVVFVAGLAVPGALAEIEALAATSG